MKALANRYSKLPLTTIIIVAGLLVSALMLVLASYFLPQEFELEQTVNVNAPSSYLYEEINDLSRWPIWSYWIDDGTQVTYGERTQGIDATCSWNGRDPEGMVKILLNKGDELVRVGLDLADYGHADCDFMIAPDTLDPSRVRLTMLVNLKGEENGVWSKLKRLVFATRFDAAIDHNLARLKQIAENKPVFTGISEELLAPSYYISVEIQKKTEHVGTERIIEAQETLDRVLLAAGVVPAGYPFCILPTDSLHHAIYGIPVPPDADLPAAYPITQFYSGAAIRGIDSADYQDIHATHHDVKRYIGYKGYRMTGDPWEVYATNPARIREPSRWITHVYYPVQTEEQTDAN